MGQGQLRKTKSVQAGRKEGAEAKRGYPRVKPAKQLRESSQNPVDHPHPPATPTPR